MLVLVQSWTVTIEKIFQIVISRSFLKKFELFYINLRIEEFTSKLTVDRSKWLPKQFQLVYPFSLLSIFFTRKIVVVLTFKSVCFLNKQWHIELLHYFSFKLVSLYCSFSKERLNFCPVLAFSSFELWFSGFDTAIFHILSFLGFGPFFRFFFLDLSHYLIVDSTLIKLLVFKTDHN